MALSKLKIKPNPGNMAFAYCRYSTDKQELSNEQQIKICQEYADSHGYKLVKEHIYCEEGITGTDDERPEYNRMLKEIEVFRPVVVIVWNYDRLARKNVEFTRVLEWMRLHGVRTISVTEPTTGNPVVDMYITGLSGIRAELFVMQLSENVTRGMSHRAENGLYNGAPILGYVGKAKYPYMIDEETAPIVQRIFREYVEVGIAKQQIADGLNAAGLRYITGKPFAISSISHVLANRAYIGEYKWGDYTIPDAIPRLIDDDIFKAAQERTELNSRGGAGARRKLHPDQIMDFELSNHAFCGYCESTVHGKSGTGKSGNVYYYYVCKSYKKHKKCELKPKRKELLEAIVDDVYEEIIQQPYYRILLAKYCHNQYQEQNAGSEAYIASLEAKKAASERKLKNIIRTIEDIGYSSSLSARVRELETEIQAQDDAIEAEKRRKQSGPQFGTILKFFDSMVDKKAFKWDFIDRVVVYNDKLVIMFKFTDDPKEVRLDEMAEMLMHKKRLLDILNKGEIPEHTPAEKERLRIMMESLLADDEENQGDNGFF